MLTPLLTPCVFIYMVSIHHVHAGAEYAAIETWKNYEDCVIEANGVKGKCLQVISCKEALDLIKKGDKPQLCYFDKNNPVVCCPVKSTLESLKSETMCREYSARKGHNSTPLFHIEIVGGSISKPKEFPHMAAIGFGDEKNTIWLCGGALISDRHVLTAAHCTFSREYGNVLWVRLGDLNLDSSTDDAAPRDFRVLNYTIHPDYKPPLKYHDIAILTLNATVTFTDYILPACLNTNAIYEGLQIIATGWGDTEFGGNRSNDLLEVNLTVFSNEECSHQYPLQRSLNIGIDYNSQFCAGSKNESKDTCQGDSGGPVQIKRQDSTNLYNIVGITSFGRTCGAANIPGVYIKVAYYVPWIEKVVWL